MKGFFLFGPILPKATYCTVYNSWIYFSNRVVTNAQSIHNSRPETLYYRVITSFHLLPLDLASCFFYFYLKHENIRRIPQWLAPSNGSNHLTLYLRFLKPQHPGL